MRKGLKRIFPFWIGFVFMHSQSKIRVPGNQSSWGNFNFSNWFQNLPLRTRQQAGTSRLLGWSGWCSYQDFVPRCGRNTSQPQRWYDGGPITNDELDISAYEEINTNPCIIQFANFGSIWKRFGSHCFFLQVPKKGIPGRRSQDDHLFWGPCCTVLAFSKVGISFGLLFNGFIIPKAIQNHLLVRVVGLRDGWWIWSWSLVLFF